jgi:hypothetical protein
MNGYSSVKSASLERALPDGDVNVLWCLLMTSTGCRPPKWWQDWMPCGRFWEMPAATATDGLGVIFVISCDEDRVAEALAKGRGRLGSSELPGSVFTRSDARRYLDRLFQFRLEIPRFPKLDMRQYASTQLAQMSDVVQDLENRNVRVQDVLDRLIHVGVQSPRNALQILNAFAQSWWIAAQRERDAVGSDGPGGLYSGAVTDHPIALAALCVLRVDFPDFYNQLQRRPELIQEFNSIVFGAGETERLSLGAQDGLREFLVVGDGGRLSREVRREYRELRRYLSSLQDLRWPERLQPLLLLSQDAISRRYGDRAAPLYEAFVSGDTTGVLEVFGHHLDTATLGETDVRLLADLAEEVSQETELRRTSAARVLADLVDRVPGEHARSLMTPLARQMVALKSVRMHVGPKSARNVIEHTTAVDQREVAGRFVEDLMTAETVEWLLPTGQSPNLDELVDTVCDAVDLALTVRDEHGLPDRADKALTAWLLSREVRAGAGSRSVPFAKLDEWIAGHENDLLKALGGDYSNLAIAEFEANDEGAIDVMEVLRRVKIVFDALAVEGEESRGELWAQLIRLVQVRSGEAVGAAWDACTTNASLASESQACKMLCAMASRLQRELDDEDAWALDWASGAKTFLELLSRWSESVDESTAIEIGGLIRSWSDVEETSEFAARGFQLLEPISTEARDRILEHLAAKAFGALPWSARELLASRLGRLSPEPTAKLVEQMDAVINADNPDHDACGDYVQFVGATGTDEWSRKPLNQHLERLLARLEAMHQNQNEFLNKLLPAGRSLLTAAPAGRAGTFLKQITEQSAGVPKAYVVVHQVLGGAWPPEAESIGTYGPDQIVERAVQFIEQNPAIAGLGAVLDSLIDLVSRGVASEDCKPKVGRAAVIAWPNADETVARNAEALATMLTPAEIGKLLTGQQPSESGPDGIRRIVGAAEKTLDDSGVSAVTHQILAESPVELNGAPDGALSLWMDVVGNRLSETLKTLLTDDGLNDVQMERLYRGAIARKEVLGLEFFLWALSTAIGGDGMPRLRLAAIESRTDIAAMATSDEAKSKLVDHIIPVLNKLGGDDLSAMLRLIRDLGGKGALERSSDVLDSMDDDNLDIVVKEMPDSRVFKRAAKARQSE